MPTLDKFLLDNANQEKPTLSSVCINVSNITVEEKERIIYEFSEETKLHAPSSEKEHSGQS